MTMLRLLVILLAALGAGCAGGNHHRMVYHYGSPWAEGAVNGVQGLFLVDTGASVTVVDRDTAERGSVQSIGSQQVVATTGDVELDTAMADSIRLAGVTHRDRMISLQDLGNFHAPGGRRQAGLIGSDFLLEYNVVFDVAASQLILSQQPGPLVGGMRAHPVRLASGTPEVEVFFGTSRDPLWAKLDTGSGYAAEGWVYLDVSNDVARRLLGDRLDTEDPVESVRIVSLAGRQELPIYEYSEVRLLGRQLRNVRLVVHTHGDGAFATPNTVLVTGSVLREFDRVELDYPRRLIWVADRTER